jgi:hypothetical protein
MALDVSSPRDGYDTPEKQKYRADVWTYLLPAWELAKNEPRAHILLMPSREGLEIKHVLSLGIPQEKIIAIDKSAAVIATSKWRKDYPDVKFFAVTVGNCGEKIRKNGYVIAAANLDFCANFCDGLVSEYANFRDSCPQFNITRTAITIAKGREGKALVSMIKAFASEMEAYAEPRMAALMACANRKMEHVIWGQGSYVSGKNPMAWSVTSSFYEKDDLKKNHIEELRCMDFDCAAKKAVAKFGKNPSRSCVRRFLSEFMIDNFMEKINALMAERTTAGIKGVIGAPYSDIAMAAEYAEGQIFMRV